MFQVCACIVKESAELSCLQRCIVCAHDGYITTIDTLAQ